MLASGLTRMAPAQTGLGGSTGTTTTALAASDLLIVVQSTRVSPLPDFDLQRFFNVANCNCTAPVSVFFTFTQSGFAQSRRCPGDDRVLGRPQLQQRDVCATCQKLGDTLALSTFAANGGIVVTTTADQLSQNFGQPSVTGTTTVGDERLLISDGGTTTTSGCNSGVAFSQTIWALVTFTGDAPYDVSATLAVNVDLCAPAATWICPEQHRGRLRERGSQRQLDGDRHVGDSGYAGLSGLVRSRGGAAGLRGRHLWRGVPDLRLDAVPGRAQRPHPRPGSELHLFEHAHADRHSWRIKVLQNDITYGVAVVAVDNSYNASAPTVYLRKAQKTLSFYDVYRNGDETNTMPGGTPTPGAASGGLCAVSGARGRSAARGLTAIALVTGLALFARRRRRPRP